MEGLRGATTIAELCRKEGISISLYYKMESNQGCLEFMEAGKACLASNTKRQASSHEVDKLLIINQVHLRRVMREYISFFNTARPHQGLEQQIPVSKITPENTGGSSLSHGVG